ncbi:MAG: carboxypeptidase-like regulatory domain-containing protein, partial [Verrucomicrobia bacterium]|nr:carboxypeptidase-like regulatory domain-containing protein [Verrucomicrobiota bacterium]
MKRKNAIPLMLGWIAIGVASTDAIHAADSGFAGATMQQTGTITGRVSNAATNTNLEGAMVRLEGTNYSAITERDGTYRLHVPAGEYQLRTSYTGLDEQTVPLSIQNGAMVRRDIELTAGIYKMSPFTVAGEREGNAQAITLQRRSDGVKTIVAADAFGSLAGNPGDLLVRLPGVNGESVGGDNRFMQIRGLHQNLLSVTMDGDRIAEATSSGTTREFNFTKINADAIERIEVVKSPTPDMDGDSIGGAVNMVSKSAFDSTGERRIRASFGAIWRAFDPRDTPRWCYSLSYSEVFGGKLAVAFNAADRRYMSLIASNSQSHQLLP